MNIVFKPVRPKLECTSPVWNSISSTGAKKLERIQRKFEVLCQNHFFTREHVPYENVLEILKLHSFYDRRLGRNGLPSFMFTQETNHFIKTDSVIIHGILSSTSQCFRGLGFLSQYFIYIVVFLKLLYLLLLLCECNSSYVSVTLVLWV
jgi:hypothetical protein